MMEIIAALTLGYVVGLLQHGININHHGEEVPTEYNKGTTEQLPEDVKKWVEETNGFHR